MTYQQSCPRCGEEIGGDDEGAVADAVVDHAATVHSHRLDRSVVVAHLRGVHPHDLDE